MIGQIFSTYRRKCAITQWRQTYPANFFNLLLGPTSTLLGILTVWNSAEPSIPGRAANCQNEPWYFTVFRWLLISGSLPSAQSRLLRRTSEAISAQCDEALLGRQYRGVRTWSSAGTTFCDFQSCIASFKRQNCSFPMGSRSLISLRVASYDVGSRYRIRKVLISSSSA